MKNNMKTRQNNEFYIIVFTFKIFKILIEKTGTSTPRIMFDKKNEDYFI